MADKKGGIFAGMTCAHPQWTNVVSGMHAEEGLPALHNSSTGINL